MTRSSETELFERLLIEAVSDNQRGYLRRFVKYTSTRNDPDHGIHIILGQHKEGRGLADTASLAWRRKNYGILDGGSMIGVSACMKAVDALCSAVENEEMALLSCVSLAHIGAIGFHVNEIANRGFIGIGMLATQPVMSVPPYSSRIVGNNLISVGVPVKNGGNMILDMSSGAMSVRAWLASLAAEADAHDSSAQRRDGQARTHALEPIGGHKGAALALAIQTLVIATGGGTPPAPPDRLTDHSDNHVLFIAIKPFSDFLSKAQMTLFDVKNRFPGIHIPGESQWS